MDSGCLSFLLLVGTALAISVAFYAKYKAEKAGSAAEALAAELASLRRELAQARAQSAASRVQAQAPAPQPRNDEAAPPVPVPPAAYTVAAATSEADVRPFARTETAAPADVEQMRAQRQEPLVSPATAASEGTYVLPLPPSPAAEPPAASAADKAFSRRDFVTTAALAAAISDRGAEPPPNQPPPPITPPPQPPPTRPSVASFDWESLVGVKLFSGIAGVALVLAAVFFLREAARHGWLSPAVRAAIGMITGAGLLVVCEMRIARGYKITANAMHGAGIAILYATLFATHARWHLLPQMAVFAMMLGVTAVAVMLSIRRDSVFIALLGLVGGFATPALLSTGDNRPIGLFSYLLLLNAGLAWIAFKKRWPVLTAVSLVFTVLYQWGWTAKFLSAQQMPLAAAIFALFAALSASMLWMSRRVDIGGDAKSSLFDRVGLAGGIVPLLFALFTAAVPAYGARYNVLFGFLLLLVAGLAAIAMTRGPQWLHLLGAVATLLTFAIWSAMSATPAAWPKIVIWIAVFVVLHLAVATRLRSSAVEAAGVLFAMFPILLVIVPATAAPGVLFTSMFVLLAVVAAFAIRYREGRVFFIASFFAIVAEGVWSANSLTQERLLPGLAIYAAFALLFVGVPAIARRFGRPLEPRSGVAMTTLLSLGVMFFLTFDRVASSTLWGLAALLAILMIGTMVEARLERRPLLAVGAVLLSWLVLASWWEGAPLDASLIPALFVVAALGVIVLLGLVWGQRGNEDDSFGGAIYLGLIGHLFLMFVASQPALGFPPWPLFAVLALLDLAVGFTALYLRRGSLMVGAAIASQVVLIIWAGNAVVAPWPHVALSAALAVAAFTCLWFYLAARRFADRAIVESFSNAVVAAVLLGSIATIIAGLSASKPMIASTTLTQAIFTVAFLVMAYLTGSQTLATVAVIMAAIATAASRASTPGEETLAAIVPYALLIGYPLILGRRAQRSIQPYLAAVLASVAFFFFGHEIFEHAGWSDVIGVLPVAEAIVLLVLLWRAVSIDRGGERMLSRLALVAGASLAFITVAIPLQLEKEWITIGWALEGAALAWLYTRIPHRGLQAWAAALLGAVFAMLVFNPAIFDYHPASPTPVLNWYLYTYLLCAASFFIAAYYATARWARNAASSGGAVLLFFLLNVEIADFYSTGSTLTFNFFSSSLAQDLTYTLFWALFAVAMLITGIALRTRGARVAALVLLLVTVLKCFLHDLGRLGGLYRVGSLLGLALSLVLVGVLLQKFVMMKRPTEAAQETP